MGLFEFLIAVSVVVILPLGLLKLILDYRREQFSHERREPAGQDNLTVGELKQIMRQVVDEANEPLVARLDSLEERSERFALDPPAAEHPDPAERTLGRRSPDPRSSA